METNTILFAPGHESPLKGVTLLRCAELEPLMMILDETPRPGRWFGFRINLASGEIDDPTLNSPAGLQATRELWDSI